MTIHDNQGQINPPAPRSLGGAGEEYHFDKAGEVVRFPSLRAYFLTILILLVALLAFGIGRLTAGRGGGIDIINPTVASAEPAQTVAAVGSVYASSKGTKYYFTHCKSTVSDANKITFASAALAEAAGYTLATNCQP